MNDTPSRGDASRKKGAMEMLIQRGKNAEEGRKKAIATGRYEYIASGENWFLLRSRWGDVIEVVYDEESGNVTDVDVW